MNANKLLGPKKHVIEFILGRKDGKKRIIGRLPNTFVHNVDKGSFVDCQVFSDGQIHYQTINADRIQKIIVGG